MGKLRISKKVHPRVQEADNRLQSAVLRGVGPKALTMFREELALAQQRYGRVS